MRPAPLADLLSFTNEHLRACPACCRRREEAHQLAALLRSRPPQPGVEEIVYGAVLSPFALMWVAAGPAGIVCIESHIDEVSFCHAVEALHGPLRYAPAEVMDALDQIGQYYSGRRRAFDLPLDLNRCTPFQRRVFLAIREIPWGETASYGDIATAVGIHSPRAVGGAVAVNPISLLIPCHRIIRADGSIGEYGQPGACAVARKRALLAHEGLFFAEDGLSMPADPASSRSG